MFRDLPTLDELERRYLQHVLQAVGGNRSRAAAHGNRAARQHPRLCEPPFRLRAWRLPSARRCDHLRQPEDPAHRTSCGRDRRRVIVSKPDARPICRRGSVGFNVHGVRVAVHRITGEIMTLQSVHAADIGRLINPMQCRGQLDGAIAMGFGWALYEKMVYDANGAMINPALRDYRIPAFADVPAAKSTSPIPMTPSARWVRRRKANAGSMLSRRQLPMRWPTRPACASPISPLTPDRIFAKLGSSIMRFPKSVPLECLRSDG